MGLLRVVLVWVLIMTSGTVMAQGHDEGDKPPPSVPTDNSAGLDEMAPPTGTAGIESPMHLLQSDRLLWFVASDHDNSVTCLTLANATGSDQTIQLTGYTLDGGLGGVWNVPVTAGVSRHVCSDSVATSPPPSWADTFVANFTDFIGYVSVALPSGVEVDGFIANNNTGNYDARVSTNTIELTFHEDSAATLIARFAPQDNDANGTCLNLVNLGSAAQQVSIRGFGTGGGSSGVWTQNLAAHGMARACSDSLVASPPPSWAGTAIFNFTDFTFHAMAILPPHVFIEGFVQWNPGTGTIDPRATDSNFLKLRVATQADLIFADAFGP